jgi:hypothetical protein
MGLTDNSIAHLLPAVNLSVTECSHFFSCEKEFQALGAPAESWENRPGACRRPQFVGKEPEKTAWETLKRLYRLAQYDLFQYIVNN